MIFQLPKQQHIIWYFDINIDLNHLASILLISGYLFYFQFAQCNSIGYRASDGRCQMNTISFIYAQGGEYYPEAGWIYCQHGKY